uniref:Uncharacterized protein n=1 Tax=Anguilla anguilla TaxID=7936 RepID=A0A0E9T373_ANGAN
MPESSTAAIERKESLQDITNARNKST